MSPTDLAALIKSMAKEVPHDKALEACALHKAAVDLYQGGPTLWALFLNEYNAQAGDLDPAVANLVAQILEDKP